MPIEGYQFSGPYNLYETRFSEVGAVYVISDTSLNPVDVGQTHNLKQRMQSHDREDCWLSNAKGSVQVYAKAIASLNERLQLESKIRSKHSFTCGIK